MANSRNPNFPWLALGIAVLASAAYLTFEVQWLEGLGFPLDDPWIHLQFARNMAAGEGLSYDGERWMPGSTAPLWTALLALGFNLFPGPSGPLIFAKALGIACFLGTVLATWRVAMTLGLAPASCRLAALFVACTHWLVWSSLSGMEILLFSGLALLGLDLELREHLDPERPRLSFPVFALAALARPEGYLLLALAVVHAWLRVRRSEEGHLAIEAPELSPGTEHDASRARWLHGALAAGVVLAPTLFFYRFSGGSFLPTTFAVKASGALDPIPSGAYLRAVFDVFFRSQPWMLLFAGAGALALCERLGGRDSRSPLIVLWVIGQPLVYSLLARDDGPVIVGNFGRYYFPLIPAVVILGIAGLERWGDRLGPWTAVGPWKLPLRGVLVLLLLAPQVWGLVRGPGRYLQTVANVETSDVRAARWLAERLDPEALLAVQDIGALGFLLPNPLVDLAGIVEPEIQPVLKGQDPGADEVYWEQRLLAYLAQRQPDYLVVFERSYPMLTSGRVPGLQEVQRFTVENNVTMAGSELVILRTPWSRFPIGEGAPQN